MTTLTENEIEKTQETRRLVVKSEMRRLQKIRSTKDHDKHSALISFPKNYIDTFNLKRGDLFVFSLVKRSPLTFTLRKVDLEENNA